VGHAPGFRCSERDHQRKCPAMTGRQCDGGARSRRERVARPQALRAPGVFFLDQPTGALCRPLRGGVLPKCCHFSAKVQLVQIWTKQNPAIYGAFPKPSAGLEPATPSLPWTARAIISAYSRLPARMIWLQIAQNDVSRRSAGLRRLRSWWTRIGRASCRSIDREQSRRRRWLALKRRLRAPLPGTSSPWHGQATQERTAEGHTRRERRA
jgi:hypothetical protein